MPVALAGTLAAAPPAVPESRTTVRQSFKAVDVDLQASTVLVNGKPAAGPASQAVLDVLGFGVKAVRPWIGGDTANPPATYQYLVVFKRPVEIGSMLLCGSGGRVAVLNDGVAWPAAPEPRPPQPTSATFSSLLFSAPRLIAGKPATELTASAAAERERKRRRLREVSSGWFIMGYRLSG